MRLFYYYGMDDQVENKNFGTPDKTLKKLLDVNKFELLLNAS